MKLFEIKLMLMTQSLIFLKRKLLCFPITMQDLPQGDQNEEEFIKILDRRACID